MACSSLTAFAAAEASWKDKPTDDFFISSTNKKPGFPCNATADLLGLGFKVVATAIL